MILVIFTVASLLMIAVALLTKRPKPEVEYEGNAELRKFYEAEGEPAGHRMRQLARAARLSMDHSESLVQQIEAVSHLHDERLVSDDYFGVFLTRKDNLVIERILIENEAEMLRPGSKDTLFAEASKMPRTEHKAPQRKKYFDEALYLKRKEILQEKLRAK